MDRERQQAVFTHFIKPFLSRNGSSGKGKPSGSIWYSLSHNKCSIPPVIFASVFFADPGCVAASNGSTEWLQANLGGFSGFATLSDLKLLNPNVSVVSGD